MVDIINKKGQIDRLDYRLILVIDKKHQKDFEALGH